MIVAIFRDLYEEQYNQLMKEYQLEMEEYKRQRKAIVRCFSIVDFTVCYLCVFSEEN